MQLVRQHRLGKVSMKRLNMPKCEEFVKLLRRLGAKEPRQPFWWRWLPV
jgi:hypothetical protein